MMSEPKRTLSDGAIIRELESTRSQIITRINDLEEVNKLWFHTISEQIRNKRKNSNQKIDEEELQGMAELFSIIIDNQDKILELAKDNYTNLKCDTSKLVNDCYENNASNDATRNSIRSEIEKINKRVNRLQYILVTICLIAIAALICK